MEKVVFIKQGDYISAESGVRRAIDALGGIGEFLQPGMKVLLKPNLLFGMHPNKCVTTHPSIVAAVVNIVREAKCEPVIGDSPVAGSGKMHYRRAGYKDICRELQVEWVEFENDVIELEGKSAFKRITVARMAAEADAIINLPKLKTHGQTYLTLCVKNMFGIIPGVRKTQWHLTSGRDVVKFAEMLVEVCYLNKPILNIVDGIMAMDGNGPRAGNPYTLGYLIAGTDPSAVDRAICEMLKVKPGKLPTIIAAENIGIGITNLDNIEILGDDFHSAPINNFRFMGQQLPRDMGKLEFLASFAKKATTSRPKIDHSLCTVCEICVKHCPAKVMSLNGKDGIEKIVIDLDQCIRCYCCSEVCPEGSISVKQGWLWKYIPGFLK